MICDGSIMQRFNDQVYVLMLKKENEAIFYLDIAMYVGIAESHDPGTSVNRKEYTCK